MDNKDFSQIIIKQQQSGLSQAEFCRQNNIKSPRFSYWKNKLQGKSVEQNDFVEFDSPSNIENFQLKFSNGITLNIPDKFNDKCLSKILMAVKCLR